MTWIALVLGAVAVVLSLVGLMSRGGDGEKRELA
jgi:hypothetical protein